MKIGGDHGSGSFKMSYHIPNVANPSSKDNTLVFGLFEAKDYRINMKNGLSRFSQQWITEYDVEGKYHILIHYKFMNSKYFDLNTRNLL